MRIAFFGDYSRYSMAALEVIRARGDLALAVEGGTLARRGGEALFRGPLAPLRRRLLRRSPWLAAVSSGLPAAFWRKGGAEAIATLLRETEVDLAVVASFPGLLPASLLSIPRLGFINAHGSLLPAYRGPNPWFWMALQGAAEGGMTLHRLDAGEDTGEILAQAAYPVPLGMTPGDHEQAATRLIAELLPEVLDRLAAGPVEGRPQADLPCPFRARRLAKDEDPYAFGMWDAAQAFHALRGGLAECRPMALRDGRSWEVLAPEAGPAEATPGTLARDGRGWYLTAREGRVRLRIRRDPMGALKGLAARLLGVA